MDNQFSTLLLPLVKKHFSDSSNIRNYINYCKKWIDRNSSIIYDTGMTVRPVFFPNENDEFIKLTGLTPAVISEFMKTSKAIIKFSRRQKSFDREIYFSMLAAIYTLHTMKKTQETKIISYILAIRFYSSLHRKYFKFEPKSEIMNYTISNLSNKYDIKNQGSLGKALEKLTETNYNTYRNTLLNKKDDESILLYIENLRTRINAFVQNVSVEFYKNHKEGNYLNIAADDVEGEDGERIKIERDSVSSSVSKATSSFSMWFSTNPVDAKVCQIVSKQTDTSYDTIRSTIEKIKINDSDEVNAISANLFELLLLEVNSPNMTYVCTKKWIPFAISQFSKTNTENKAIINLKRIFSKLLEKYSIQFASTTREATKINYRKALLLYFAVIIQRQRCG